MQSQGNKQYKDNIFRYLFLDAKNFVQLYYDITGKHLNENEIEPYDTESIVIKQLKNDVAFKTKDNRLIVMVEHQSTLNENMPLRFLLYYAELLKLYISQNDLNIFTKRAISIPKPEFFVVYNGTDELNDLELQLKKNLDGMDDYINVKVDIMNINYDQLSEKVKERDDVLIGYSYLMDRIRVYHRDKKLLLEEAIDRAIEETSAMGYLKEYLDKKEFITMITKLLTIEEEINLIRRDERAEGIAEGKAEGVAEGMTKGMAKGKIEIAKNLLDVLDIPIIAEKTGLSVEEIEALKH